MPDSEQNLGSWVHLVCR